MLCTAHTTPRLIAVVSALALIALTATDSHARPPIRSAFFSTYPTAVGSRLDNLPSHAGHCDVCHYDFNGGGARNPYGVRVGTAIITYGSAAAAIPAIENEDSDADGISNRAEIVHNGTYSNTPTFPGLNLSNLGSALNIPVVAEISPYLTPTTGADGTPPTVTVTTPNGGQSWTGGTMQTITYTATDNVGVIAVDIDYKDGASGQWNGLARGIAPTGSFTWFVHDTPTPSARVRVIARDAAANSGQDESNADFTIAKKPGGIVPTTLRDFKMGGTQPFETTALNSSATCLSCHGGYDTAAEPGRAWKGTMMGQAARDPLFEACMAVAEQDAPGAGDLCLRCHTPGGWMAGRSNPTNGSQLVAGDRDAINCDFCHRAVDPVYKPGVSPTADQAVLSALMMPAHSQSNGQYVIDPDTRRRGPYGDPVTPHAWLQSPFHRSSDWCGTCHDVSNPVFNRVSGADYAAGPLDARADSVVSTKLFPLERTYSEWKASAFPAGLYQPEFAGVKPDGIVSNCLDCHLADVSGKGCNDPAAPTRSNLGFHDMTGGNAWMPRVLKTMWPGEVDVNALEASALRATSMLQRAATLDVVMEPAGDSLRAVVTVTNRSGHKLPSGYPEGRRMWLHVVARDGPGNQVYESGAYDPATGELSHDADVRIYETKLGITKGLGEAIGLPHGASFHFALNESVYKDNRIPPQGFTNSAFDLFGGRPVENGVTSRYADGQHWDVTTYPLPPSARTVVATLYYQTMSREYVEFLRDQNTTNTAGTNLYNLWTANGRCAPVLMVRDSTLGAPVAVDDRPIGRLAVRALTNPSRGDVRLAVELPRAGAVRYDVVDARGRTRARREAAFLAAGRGQITWDGRDDTGRATEPGTFWIVVRAGGETAIRQVVRLR